MNRRSVTSAGPDWLGLVAAAGALASCYGTLALVTVLAALGITPGVDDRLWAAAIALFTLVAVGAIALGSRRHGRVWSALLAIAGAGLILWALFGGYDLAVELGGFAALMAAAAWDWRVRRTNPGSPLEHYDTAQRPGLPATGTGNHHLRSPEAGDALTFNPDQSD